MCAMSCPSRSWTRLHCTGSFGAAVAKSLRPLVTFLTTLVVITHPWNDLRRIKGKGKCIAVCINTYTAMGNHLPYGIIQCYLPPGRGDFPAFTPAEAGTRDVEPCLLLLMLVCKLCAGCKRLYNATKCGRLNRRACNLPIRCWMSILYRCGNIRCRPTGNISVWMYVVLGRYM